jgi:hypothetical protein
MHQGALALIDVEEGAATVADSAQQAWPSERKTPVCQADVRHLP